MSEDNKKSILNPFKSERPTPARTSPEEPSKGKPKRVKLKNTKASNGKVGGIARPLEKDVDAWLAAGWVKAD